MRSSISIILLFCIGIPSIIKTQDQVECDQANNYYNLAFDDEKHGKTKQAIYNYKKAISLDHSLVNAYINLSELFCKCNNDKASALWLKEGHKYNPNHIVLTFKLANILTLTGNIDEAIGYYHELANHKFIKDTKVILYNLAYAKKTQGKVDEAIILLKDIIQQKPEHEDAQFGLGMSLLYKGDFEQAWKQHDRFLRSTNRYTPILKEWIQTGKLKGKKILLRQEGGFGDTIQFIRYAELLHNAGAYVIFVCPDTLFKLLQRCTYIDQLIPLSKKDEFLVAADAFTTPMTLPALFMSTEETIPRNIPYIFADPILFETWKKNIEKDKNLKIGICWIAGYESPPNVNILSRSIPLSTLAQIGILPNVSLYCLQKNTKNEQFNDISAEIKIYRFGTEFDKINGAFMDTAAIMQHLDLVISVDTSIAHLAGSLGVPIWLLLTYMPDWRWIINRTDSPWYPTMRIFKQSTPYDWDSVISKIITELKNHFTEKIGF